MSDRSLDPGMRVFKKVLQPLRMPVVAARLTLLPVHALLHDRPLAVLGQDEPM
jgi:hypothetical protein